jgi:putative flippase GtrA
MSDRELPKTLDSLLSGVRFGQFVSVGVVGLIADTITLVALTELIGVEPWLAGLLSIEAAILVMFAVNERWTFAGIGEPGQLLRRLVKSHAVRSVGSSIQYGIFYGLVTFTGISVLLFGSDIWYLFSKWIAVGVAMFVNYAFESLFTWRVHAE